MTKAERKEYYNNKQWYNIRSLLGNKWASFYILIGARERGKSYSVQDYVLNQRINHDIPFVWIRLNEAATNKMLANNGAKMFEPLLVKKYHLEDIKVKAGTAYYGKDDKDVLCRVLALSTAFNDKGSALFNAGLQEGINIVIDEFQLEKGQKRTFDVVYNLKMQIENLTRSQSEGVRVFFIGNNTEECSDILSLFNFIPIEFGVYKLKSRRCIIDYIPNTIAYNERRKQALANILEGGGKTGNFTNKVIRDIQLIRKDRLMRPQYIIKFSKDKDEWFTVWNKNIIAKWNGEKKPAIAMKRYIDEGFDIDTVNMVFEQFDARAYYFHNMITQTQFQYQLSLIKAK